MSCGEYWSGVFELKVLCMFQVHDCSDVAVEYSILGKLMHLFRVLDVCMTRSAGTLCSKK